MATDVATLIARIRSTVNVQDTAVLPDADILEAINDAQELIVQAGSEWQSMEQTIDLGYAATDDGVPLPTNFQKLAQSGVNMLDGTQTDPSLRLVPILPTERGQWLDRGTQPQVDRVFTLPEPELHYYLWAGKLYLVPQPGDDLTVRLDYLGPPPDLTTSPPNNTTTFLTQFFRTFKWGALAIVWDFLHQEDLAALAQARFERRLDRAKAVAVAAHVAGPKRIRGS